MKNRNGVTLLEILLVVAVIAILSALSLPLWSVMLESEKVSRGADILRAELGRTRVNAIREGEEYVFCYVLETGQFWNEPLAASTQFSISGVGDSPTDKLSLPPVNQLPEGVLFSAGEAQESIRSMAAEEEEGSGDDCERVIFFPDGTAQTSGIVISNQFGDVIQVTVRGITGSTSASGFLVE
ncbi:MAG: prepilin-type N-terminal cleavage/methylation domain-containing protein [Pirellulaceae bacterium]|jgi:prepilin-type N-terminal cleavage/methylation domain-containing protein|nr:prepilin-type N-terminal cleavage/methylation domain-containing protein [Pirellulaceae bacterium]